MSLESATEGGTQRARNRWTAFREWRATRPFGGGVLLCLAGLLIGYVPMQFAFELMLVGGGYTYIGLVWALGVFATGVLALQRPELSTTLGAVGVVLSILSLLGALGGLFVGMLVGIVGGNLCIAWSPSEENRDEDGDRGGGETDEDGDHGGGDGETDEDGDRGGGDGETDDAGGFEFDNGHDGDEREDGDRERSVPGSDDGRREDHSGDGILRTVGAVGGVGGDVERRRSRLAVSLAIVVVTSGTLTLVGVAPATAILGEMDETTYTVDVEEIRLGDDGRICASSVGGNTYQVLVTDATLVDATIYQQTGGRTLKSEFPTLEVAGPLVMHTTGQNGTFSLLSTTVGCTTRDQTSRTVFQNRYQTSSLLRGGDGVTMSNVPTGEANVPEPGGFEFVGPIVDNGSVTDVVGGGVGGVTDGIGDTNGSLNDAVGGLSPNATGANDTAPPSGIGPVTDVTAGLLNGTVGVLNGTADGLPLPVDVHSLLEGSVAGLNGTDHRVVPTDGNGTGPGLGDAVDDVVPVSDALDGPGDAVERNGTGGSADGLAGNGSTGGPVGVGAVVDGVGDLATGVTGVATGAASNGQDASGATSGSSDGATESDGVPDEPTAGTDSEDGAGGSDSGTSESGDGASESGGGAGESGDEATDADPPGDAPEADESTVVSVGESVLEGTADLAETTTGGDDTADETTTGGDDTADGTTTGGDDTADETTNGTAAG